MTNLASHSPHHLGCWLYFTSLFDFSTFLPLKISIKTSEVTQETPKAEKYISIQLLFFFFRYLLLIQKKHSEKRDKNYIMGQR